MAARFSTQCAFHSLFVDCSNSVHLQCIVVRLTDNKADIFLSIITHTVHLIRAPFFSISCVTLGFTRGVGNPTGIFEVTHAKSTVSLVALTLVYQSIFQSAVDNALCTMPWAVASLLPTSIKRL